MTNDEDKAIIHGPLSPPYVEILHAIRWNLHGLKN